MTTPTAIKTLLSMLLVLVLGVSTVALAQGPVDDPAEDTTDPSDDESEPEDEESEPEEEGSEPDEEESEVTGIPRRPVAEGEFSEGPMAPGTRSWSPTRRGAGDIHQRVAEEAPRHGEVGERPAERPHRAL